MARMCEGISVVTKCAGLIQTVSIALRYCAPLSMAASRIERKPSSRSSYPYISPAEAVARNAQTTNHQQHNQSEQNCKASL
mmetsp:Transcript_18735/g.39873  ORF Transcript_18735/g.39873 Transcript_18735/m.39873 type:complete len:81 (+) Transcript_18735:126-368(+)